MISRRAAVAARVASGGASAVAIATWALVWAAVGDGCFVGIDESLLRDAGANADGASVDAAGDGPASAPYVGVVCGDAACAPPVVCCATTYGDTDPRRGICSMRDPCQTGDYFGCTRGRDCAYAGAAGPRCCVVRLPGGAFTQTACQADCDGGTALCAATDTAPCADGGRCGASLEFPTLFECTPP